MILKRLIIIIFILFSTASHASITEELVKLTDLFKQGLLTEAEFKKAKSILLEINEINKEEEVLKSKKKLPKEKKKKKIKISKKSNKSKENAAVKIERIYDTVGSKFTTKSYEKMKLTVGDFLIYTHRPGAIKIKKISDNKQLAVIGDKLEVKYYNNGQDFFVIDVNKKDKLLNLIINGSKVLLWKGQYVQEAEATFYQILAMGRTPFHYYIKLDTASLAFALNMEKFTRRIELAVENVKVKLANEFNLTIDQIDEVINDNDMLAANRFIKNETLEDEKLLKKKKNKLYSELEASLGKDKFSKLSKDISSDINAKLEGTISKEIQVVVDKSIRDAINSGIEAAALEAGLMALIEALLSGDSWADALKAGEQACASSGGC